MFSKCPAHDRSKELWDLQLSSVTPASQWSPSTIAHVHPLATGLLLAAEVNRSLSSSHPLMILPFLSMHFIEGVPLTKINHLILGHT